MQWFFGTIFNPVVFFSLTFFIFSWCTKLRWASLASFIFDIAQYTFLFPISSTSHLVYLSSPCLVVCSNSTPLVNSFSSLDSPTSIGSIIHDSFGIIFIHFTKHVSTSLMAHAELLAVREYFLLITKLFHTPSLFKRDC